MKNNGDKLYVGSTWNPNDIAVIAKDVDGSMVPAENIQITGAVNISKAGNYQLTYSFTDSLGHSQSQMVIVTVLENQASIAVTNKSGKLFASGTWNPADIEVTAKDVDGSDVEADKIQVTGAVDMSKTGNYDLTYSFTDSLGHLQSQTVTITVLENQASIAATNKGGKLFTSGTWNPADIEVTAKDVDGSDVEADKIQVTGAVDMSKDGNYDLNYSFVDSLGHLQSKTVTVTVLENQASIAATNKGGTLYAGGKWNPANIEVTAKDVDGSDIEVKDIKIDGTIDTSSAGDNLLTYYFVDSLNHKHATSVNITVLKNQAGIKVNMDRESFRVGAQWSAKDNLISATNVDGTLVDLASVKINSTVDAKNAGEYEVTYSFTDQQGKLQKVVVPVEVLANLASIQVKATNESFRVGVAWSAEDNLLSATDVDGRDVDLENIQVDNTVNPQVAGKYEVTYSFTDQQGKLQKVVVPVEVLANLASIQVKAANESFRVGATWSAKDNLISATNVDGTPVDLASVEINSTVDAKNVGKYEVTYSFTDQQGKLQKVVVPVEVLANMASIQVKATNESFRVGATWSAKDNLISVTDVDGSPVDLKNVQIDDTVNPQTVGQYEVTYSFTDQQGKVQKVVVPVEVLENMASLQVKSTNESFRIGATWLAENNLLSATDVDGSDIDLSKIQVESGVNPQVAGKYEVTYSFTDQQGKLQKVVVPVEVLANMASIQVKSANESFRVGATWSAKDNLISATDVDGSDVDLKNIQVDDTVNPQVAGKYEVTYSFTDQQGKLQKVVVPVEVLVNMASIQVKSANESFRVGSTWSAKDNLISATDVDGSNVNLKNVQVESTVNPQTVGKYEVTYSFTDQQGKLQKVVVPVEVLANMASIQVKEDKESFRVGAIWSVKDNLISATNVDGTPVDLASVEINSTVDANNVGKYEVTYSFTDQQGKLQKVVVPVEVLANLASIQVKAANESFRVDATWSAKDNLISATNVDGTSVDLASVEINSTVDAKNAGKYEVTYSFTDQQGKLQRVVVPVEVLANMASIQVKVANESFRIGATWSAKDNLISATDIDGSAIDLSKVQVESTVNPQTVGQYEVMYSFTDQQGKLQKVVVPVEVLANLAAIQIKSTNENFRIGATWSAKDNLISATNVDGTPVDLASVEINSTVDTKNAGKYEVTYSFTDQQGKLQKVVVPVEVLANLASIQVKSANESFRIGATWSAKDNLVSATDVDGSAIDLKNVQIDDTVNPKAVGQYEVTYSFIGQQGKLQKVVVPVEVLANMASLQVKAVNESFRIGATWSAKDNLISATDVDGSAVDLKNVQVESTVNPQTVGQYEVTYSFIDQQGKQQKVTVPVNVLANHANLNLYQTEISFRAGDNSWQPETNVALVTDVDGSAIAVGALQITNTVDATTPGTYQVSYAFTDQLGKAHIATTTVTVLENLATLMTKQNHVTLYLGNQQWQPEDNLELARNVDGSTVATEQLQLIGDADLTTVGDYELTYQFVDQLGQTQSAWFTVTVAQNRATIVVKQTDVVLRVGDTWEPMQNLVNVTDVDGSAVANERIIVNVTKLNQRVRLMMMMRSRALPVVDTTTVGSYNVSYQFTDGNGNLQELVTTVNVLPNEASLKLGATDVTCYVGDQWQAETNVVAATNVDGTPVTADQLSITGSVNMQVTGQYHVLYRFIDQQNKVQEAVATVTVLTNQAGIQLNYNQLTLTVGDQWQPLTNLKSARDVNGQAIDSSDIVVTGNVDTNTPDSYQVNYSFTDQQGHQQAAVATVTVVAPTVNDQSALRLQADQVTLRAGAVWNPRSNVAQVRDVDGSLRTADQVSVQGTVDLDTVGKYLLTYHFTDQLGHDHTASATVIVLANEASLQLRATAVTLKVGQNWDAAANILAATDVDGQSVDQAVTITSNVDWQQPGTYQVMYSFVDQQGKTHTATTNLTLMAADTDNGSSNQGGNSNTDNGSGNQGGNGNTDNGSGNQGGNGNTDNGSGNQGGNSNTDNGSGNQGGTGNADNGSSNQGGTSNADNGSSNQGGTSTTDNGTSTNVDQQPDSVNPDAKRVVAKRSAGTAINHHANATASSTMASRDMITTDTVR
ncbi:DUF5011 domain-containing protein [Lactiplantibacillus paraplantarum]|uniref:bacterial Ig-like domain-containing protein n=1 Tax=Lactiplantibacillus paraplantarum TaxID=60520 RepID=UPI0021A260C2|nr:DUF5011 domain-containing protein [Lactiplantibacillus paraplantarum]